MSEIALLLRLLDESYEKKAWQGPNLKGSLRGVTARAGRLAAVAGPAQHLGARGARGVLEVRGLADADGREAGGFAEKGSNWFASTGLADGAGLARRPRASRRDPPAAARGGRRAPRRGALREASREQVHGRTRSSTASPRTTCTTRVRSRCSSGSGGTGRNRDSLARMSRLVDLSHPIEHGMITYPGLARAGDLRLSRPRSVARPLRRGHDVPHRAPADGRRTPARTSMRRFTASLTARTSGALPLERPRRPRGRRHRRREPDAAWTPSASPGSICGQGRPDPDGLGRALADAPLRRGPSVPDAGGRGAPRGGRTRARRDRLAQHRRYVRRRAPRPHAAALGRHPDRRAPLQPGSASGRPGFRFHCVPAPFRGLGSFPVRAYARSRNLRERRAGETLGLPIRRARRRNSVKTVARRSPGDRPRPRRSGPRTRSENAFVLMRDARAAYDRGRQGGLPPRLPGGGASAARRRLDPLQPGLRAGASTADAAAAVATLAGLRRAPGSSRTSTRTRTSTSIRRTEGYQEVVGRRGRSRSSASPPARRWPSRFRRRRSRPRAWPTIR